MIPSLFDPAFWGLSPAATAPRRTEQATETTKPAGGALQDYLVDAWQRSILFLDILRRRGNEQEEMASRPMATVLAFDHEVLMSGRSLPRPINYSLSRIAPLAGVDLDPRKRPVVVVDPRAGQGPGIGSFKTQSEIGDALASGHPVYFIGFSARPEPGQTFLDVVEGQVAFFERIVELHPDAPRPFAIGNCQAGYQTLMVAMLRPDLFGPCMAAGSPMSFWQGVRGKNPMRYAGGLAGGSWLTAFLADLGRGKFDGAWLIENFDELNPANWLWSKQYGVYSAVDTEGPRYLGFEKWWGDFVELNGEEIQFLVDEMFIGDKLARNGIRADDGTIFDLRNIVSPIIVFTSLGDNISPPQQTLGWIVDLYEDVDEIRAEGRTIVYCLNQTVGHLAIFVSAKVGAKEDEEMVRLMDVLDCLPPGLYELVISPADVAAGEGGAWRSRFEMRTLDDIRALGRNSVEDDRAFAAAKRVSEIDHALYCAFVQPAARALVTPQLAELLFETHPLRLGYRLFSDSNPFMKDVAERADEVKSARRPVAADNPFLLAEKRVSDTIVASLDAFRDMRDRVTEQTFFSIYRAPVLQAALGMAAGDKARELPGVGPQRRASRERRLADLRAKTAQGGFDEALTRAVLFVISAERTLDDRCAQALNVARQRLMSLSIDSFKALVREQFAILLEEREAAMETLPALVSDEGARRGLLDDVTAIVGSGGALTLAERLRVEKIAGILGVSSPEAPPFVAEDIGFRKTRRRVSTTS
ncbi:DUF3141 domain-containing protein [Methylosinus sp. KRF6]|nr:DUF3141 domain-containing protein [Methylosinus sp. KRF6]